MRLRFTPDALAELDQILNYVSKHSPNGARRVKSRIQSIVQILVDQPQIGQRTSIDPMRRVVATPYPYLIFYELSQEEVVILGVRHAVRDPLTMPGQRE